MHIIVWLDKGEGIVGDTVLGLSLQHLIMLYKSSKTTSAIVQESINAYAWSVEHNSEAYKKYKNYLTVLLERIEYSIKLNKIVPTIMRLDEYSKELHFKREIFVPKLKAEGEICSFDEINNQPIIVAFLNFCLLEFYAIIIIEAL